jgi:hypothetical protein
MSLVCPVELDDMGSEEMHLARHHLQRALREELSHALAALHPREPAVLRQLRRSPLALDVYAWITWRMSFLRKSTPIPWEHLSDQFGSNYARPLDFRKNFRKALVEVLRHYPANVEPGAAGIVLKPSPPSIARTR